MRLNAACIHDDLDDRFARLGRETFVCQEEQPIRLDILVGRKEGKHGDLQSTWVRAELGENRSLEPRKHRSDIHRDIGSLSGILFKKFTGIKLKRKPH